MIKRIIVPVILLVSGQAVSGQQAVTNKGNLQVHAGASVRVFGNFTNTSTGAVVNNSSLYISGNITNDQASMAPGTGTLYLNGSAAQAINGSQSFKTHNLNSNNSSGITLNNNLSVSGIHTFAAGIITSSATPNYLVYEAGSSYNGNGNSRHVNGWVKKFGSTNFVFPVGNGTIERTVAISSLSANSEFSARYLATPPNPYQTQMPVWEIDRLEYWSVQKASGGSASVTLNWDYSKVYFPNYIIPDIRVAGYNGTLWTNNGGSASGNAATTGTITSSSISSFNLFTFGSISYVLPLTLINFNAVRHDNYTQISWTTEKEYQSDRFVVERSDNGTTFYSIGQLPARNTGLTESYGTRDYAPINRVAFYRLRSVDLNNQENISRTVTVMVNAGRTLNLLTNPVHDQVTLVGSRSLNGVFDYTITAINGQLVQQGKLRITNGGTQVLSLEANLKPGIYSLDVFNIAESFNFKVSVR